MALSNPTGPLQTAPLRRPVPLPASAGPRSLAPDPLVQAVPGPLVNTSAGLNFDGLGQGVNGFSVHSVPPDPDGAIGATQYVQWVNTSFAVFDKITGALIKGPVAGNVLFANLGNSCATNNDGDPVVLYDKLANRWLFSQFSITRGPPYLQCIAVSTTPDATGTFNVYSFTTPFVNDYTKFGVWPDAYYSSSNEFDSLDVFHGGRVCAFDRTAMINGNAATAQCFQLSVVFGNLLPSDLDGTAPPPAGAPDYFLNFGSNSLNLWRFHVDFVNANNSSFTGPANLPVAAFSQACNGGACIPQLGTTQQLDSLGDRLMFRLAYRNFGDHEALVANHSVATGGVTGIRWYEVRSPNSAPVLYQQGTFAPDSNYRWMGSIAMDHVGNMAVGYSVSGSSMNPAIRYTGRAAGDALGTLQSEATLIAGSASETSTNRWGDYTAMTVDPVDDCTFWYTNEYFLTAGSRWNTRIASFKFPTCSTPTPPPPSGTPLVSGFSLNALRNNFSGFVGMRFTVGATALSVNALGRVYVAGNNRTHTVKLVRASDGVDVPGAAVSVPLPSGIAGQFAYVQLPGTVTLTANTSYFLVSQETAGGDQWYEYTSVTPASGLAVNGPVYATSPTTYFLVPGSANYSYVPVSLLFTTSSVVPPTIAIRSPSSGATVSGKTLAIVASAEAASGLTVASVQFKVDGNNFGAPVTVAPYQTVLDTTTLVDGAHSLTAVATDSATNSTTSAPVTINVSNGGPAPAGTEFIGSVTVSSLRNNYTGFVGLQFTVGGQNLTINALGRMFVTGNTGTHTVKLVNAGTGIDVPNGTVSINMAGGAPAKFKYANLASAITLPAGTSYYLVSQETSGGDQWYDLEPVTPASVATIPGPVYFSGFSYVLVQSPDYSYVPVSFLFGGGVVVTPPPTVSITSPLAGATVSGSVPVTATAQAAPGLTIITLQYKVDGSVFTPPLDTTTLTNGQHTLTAVAVDSAGNTGTSAPVTINVNNVAPPPPPPPPSSGFITGQSLGALRNNFTGFVGMQFTVGNTALNVTQLGRICVGGNSQAHSLKLVAAGNGADLPGGSTSVSMAGCTPGQYQYAALAVSVSLTPQTAYYVLSQETSQGDQWYDYGPVTAAAGVGTVNGPVYLAGAYVLVWSPGASYVPVNFLYATSTSAPPSVAITSPSPNAPVTGTITISATATAASGLTIANVQFKVNGNNIGPAVTGAGPTYSVQLDTTTLTTGTNQLAAVATDSVGGIATSASVPINVSNPGTPPPAGNPLITGQSTVTLRNNFSGLVGMRFTTSAPAITVTSLGRICVAGNTGTHLVKLAAANGVDVVGGSVSIAMTGCTPGAYRYATLAGPIQLAANTTYHLVSQEQQGGDQWYDYCPVTSTSAAVVNGPVYFANGYFLVTSPGYSYVPLSLLYQ